MQTLDLEELRRLGQRAAEACGVDLAHAEFIQSGRRRILRYIIEKEGGVSLDDCARVSRLVSSYLEVADPVEGAYNLEVSSPGVDRPLFCDRDYERFAGKTAALKLRLPREGRRDLRGQLLGLSGGKVRFEDRTLGRLEIPIEHVEKGHLIGEVELAAPRPSGKKPRKRGR